MLHHQFCWLILNWNRHESVHWFSHGCHIQQCLINVCLIHDLKIGDHPYHWFIKLVIIHTSDLTSRYPNPTKDRWLSAQFVLKLAEYPNFVVVHLRWNQQCWRGEDVWAMLRPYLAVLKWLENHWKRFKKYRELFMFSRALVTRPCGRTFFPFELNHRHW